MSENGEIYTAAKNFTLPPALTEWTNSTSGNSHIVYYDADLRTATLGLVSWSGWLQVRHAYPMAGGRETPSKVDDILWSPRRQLQS